MEENALKKVMPRSQEAEQAVIGAMLIDQNVIAGIMEILTAEDFFEKRNALLYEAMTGLYTEGKPVDLVTLQNRLQQMDAPPEVCGLDYISNLMDVTPLSVNGNEYAKIVAEKAQLRRVIRVTEEIAGKCYADHEPVDELMAEAEKNMFQVLQQRSSDDFVPIRDIVLSALEKIEAASKQQGSVTGHATGFIDLDYKTSGFQPSDLILIAARPSMGKTAFVLNIGAYMAFRQNKKVAIFSLEMSKEQLVNRMLAMESHVDAQLLRNGNLSDSEWSNLIEGAGVIGSSGLMIDDTPGISVNELRSKCRKFKLEKGLDCIMIDYLQLMTGSKKSESRQQEISDISRSLKEIARELKVPVVALSQLSRAVETRPDHRPIMSDLRESGAIEQDADVIMFIYRDDYYNHDTDRKDIAEVIIAKQRNGPIGTVELAWLPKYTKFANMAK